MATAVGELRLIVYADLCNFGRLFLYANEILVTNFSILYERCICQYVCNVIYIFKMGCLNRCNGIDFLHQRFSACYCIVFLIYSTIVFFHFVFIFVAFKLRISKFQNYFSLFFNRLYHVVATGLFAFPK